MNLTYVASVYSQGNADAALLQKRYEVVLKWVATNLVERVQRGEVLYSPIAHNHEMAKVATLPKTWDFWKQIDVATLKHCAKLIVLQMPGWEESVGIQAEIEVAKANCIPIEYIRVDMEG